MARFSTLTTASLLVGFAPLASGAVFDFGDGNNNTNNSQESGDGNWNPFPSGENVSISTSVSETIGGITMTLLRAEVTGGDTGDDFWGINDQGIGVITDGAGGPAGRRLSGDVGESVVFSFDVDVFLDSARFGNFNASETVEITPAGGSTITITGAQDPDFDNALGGVLVTAGTEITMTTTGNNGVLFNEITVSEVPEPSSSLALLGLGGLAMLRRRR